MSEIKKSQTRYSIRYYVKHIDEWEEEIEIVIALLEFCSDQPVLADISAWRRVEWSKLGTLVSAVVVTIFCGAPSLNNNMISELTLQAFHSHPNRRQQYASSQYYNALRLSTSALQSKQYFGQGNGLVERMIFHTQNRPSTSNPNHVLEAIAQNRPTRPSRFLEEKKWPPRELIGNPWREKTRTNAASQSLVHQICTTPRCVGATLTYSKKPSEWSPANEERLGQFQSHLHYPKTISSISTPQIEPPFRLESNQEKRLKEEEWLPDLQLRLSQRSANEEDTHHKSKYEMNTMLSLSPYSSRQQEQPTEKQKEETQTNAWPSQTTTGKADLSLSI
uniref:Uncharacterized protein n=1 Tax=Vitis vinifera TaxID=29760 RepID=A5ACW9_VITVI|nr:hypothetical protein VITISV_022946 [Vitis vinifera]